MQGGGDKPHEPNEATRQLVQLHSTIGTPQPQIADLVGVSEKTLRKHYRRELDLATAQANANVGGALYKKAMAGDVTAMIFWMKTRAKWSERQSIEMSGPDGGPIQIGANEAFARLAGRLAGDQAGAEGGTPSEE